MALPFSFDQLNNFTGVRFLGGIVTDGGRRATEPFVGPRCGGTEAGPLLGNSGLSSRSATSGFSANSEPSLAILSLSDSSVLMACWLHPQR